MSEVDIPNPDPKNVITQKMRDYWLISEIFDAGIPDDKAIESDTVESYDVNDKGEIVHFYVPLSECVEPNWDCVECRKQAVKICLCDMELYCWTHLDKHVKDNIQIVSNLKEMMNQDFEV